MKFEKLLIPDAWVAELEPIEDDRGFFARAFCREEFLARGMNPEVAQCNISFNRRKGTVRGMHYQVAPHQEAKMVRCTRGAIFDVVLDLRRNSVAYKRWIGVELTADNHKALYLPEGVAHGFQSLTDETEVFYQMAFPFHPASGRGVRYDDPAFGIRWPLAEVIVSERDGSYPLYAD